MGTFLRNRITLSRPTVCRDNRKGSSQMRGVSMNRQKEMDESDVGAGFAPARTGINTPSFCLGYPSHTLQPGQVTCHTCGALAANTEIGVYRIQKSLGMGRSGHAYLALHSTSRQPVCVKVTTTGQSNTQLWDAARREVRSITALRHPAILPVFSCSVWQANTNRLEQMSSGSDYSTQSRPSQVRMSGNSFLLTLNQYVQGTLPHFISYYQKRETRQQMQARGISPLKLLLQLMMQIGSALQTAHSRGITHGAVVPGNILLASYERCWLADFGIAKLSAPPVPYLPPELYNASSASTQLHSLDAYGRSVTPLSDQYMFATLCQQLFSQILQPGEYQQFLPVLQRATQQRAERRYESIDQLLLDMELSSPSPSVSVGNRQQTFSSNHNTSPPRREMVTPEPFAHPITPILALAPNASIDTPGGPQGTPFSADDWEKQGDKFFTQRAYDDALNAYHRAIEIVNKKAPIWLALGDTYFALQRNKEALMAYDQAMYLNPNDPQAWSSRGTILDVMGRHQEAVECYERAERLQLTS